MESFVLPKYVCDVISDINEPIIRLEIYESLIRYSFDKVEPTDISEKSMMVFRLVKPIFDRYTELRNNAKKGGRPKKTDGFKNEKPMVLENENQNKLMVFEDKKPMVLDNKNQRKNYISDSLTQTESSSYDNINDNVTNDVDEENLKNSDIYIYNKDIYIDNNKNNIQNNINNIVNNTDNSLLKEKENKKEKEKNPQKSENVPYEEIKNLFNDICKSLPRIRDMSSTRKNKVRLRWNEIGKDIGVIKEIFERVQKSQYCTGNNNHGWRATFDWIFDNDRNINKILEGNYDNRINNNRRATTEIPISQKIFNDTTIYDD